MNANGSGVCGFHRVGGDTKPVGKGLGLGLTAEHRSREIRGNGSHLAVASDLERNAGSVGANRRKSTAQHLHGKDSRKPANCVRTASDLSLLHNSIYIHVCTTLIFIQSQKQNF